MLQVKDRAETIREQARILLQPKNLAKTIVSIAPFVSEAIGQIEDHLAEEKIAALEHEIRNIRKLTELEQQAPPFAAPVNDWSRAVSEYFHRTVDFALFYDVPDPAKSTTTKNVFKVLTHGCRVDENEVITSREAFEIAAGVAKERRGELFLLTGMARYSFEPGAIDETTGLLSCGALKRDEDDWNEMVAQREAYGLPPIKHPSLPPIKFSPTPYVGNEFGFIHTGEAKNVMAALTEISRRQFDSSCISHFRKPIEGGFKTFVSNVLGSDVLRFGSPVFMRDATLIGFVSGLDVYDGDNGRRVVVRSLLGHPRFRSACHTRRSDPVLHEAFPSNI